MLIRLLVIVVAAAAVVISSRAVVAVVVSSSSVYIFLFCRSVTPIPTHLKQSNANSTQSGEHLAEQNQPKHELKS